MFKMLPTCILFITSVVTLALAKEEPFSIGLGVLSPSYSQTVGKEGVKVNFEQKDNGAFSFSIGDQSRGVSHYHHLGEAAKNSIAASPELHKSPEPATHSFHGAGAAAAHHPQPIPYASGAAHGHHLSAAPVNQHFGHAPAAHHAGPAQHSFAQSLPKADGGYVPTAHHNAGHGGPALAPAGHTFAFNTALGGHSAGAAAGAHHGAPVAYHGAPASHHGGPAAYHGAPAAHHGGPAAHHGGPVAAQPYNGVPQVTYYNSIGGHGFQTAHQFDGAARGQGQAGYSSGAHASAPVAAPAVHAYAGAGAYNSQGLNSAPFQGSPFNSPSVQVGQGYVHQGLGGRDHGGHSHEDLQHKQGHFGVQG